MILSSLLSASYTHYRSCSHRRKQARLHTHLHNDLCLVHVMTNDNRAKEIVMEDKMNTISRSVIFYLVFIVFALYYEPDITSVTRVSS